MDTPEITQDWHMLSNKLRTAFPHLDLEKAQFLKQDTDRLLAHIAQSNHLTYSEVSEMVQDLMLGVPDQHPELAQSA